MQTSVSPVKLEMPSIEDFFMEYYGLKEIDTPDVQVKVEISDRIREAYYDFASLTLQLGEYGFTTTEGFPQFDDSTDPLFSGRFADDGDKRIYVQRGIKDGQSYWNIGIRNYKWPGMITFVSDVPMAERSKYIRPISYGPNVLNDIMKGLDQKN